MSRRLVPIYNPHRGGTYIWFTVPDGPEPEAAGLGRSGPTPYDLGITDDPAAAWQDGRSAGSGVPVAGLTAPGGGPLFLGAGGRLVYDAEPESAARCLVEYAAEDRPVPYSLTPAAEAALPGIGKIEEALAEAEEFYGRTPGTAARLVADYEIEDPAAAYEVASELLDEWYPSDAESYQAQLEAEAEP